MRNYLDDLKELLLSDISSAELLDELENYHDSDIADALESLSEEERLRAYDKIGVEKLSFIFSYYENVEDYVEELEPEVVADIIEQMDSDDAVEILNELDEEDKSEIMELMEDEAAEQVAEIDSYDEEEIGSYMSNNYITVSTSDNIKSATAKMITEAGEHDNIFTIYVTDESDKYCGAINFKDLIRARQTDSLDDLIMRSYPFFYDKELMSDCISKLKDYAEDSIPVLNRRHEIIGVITADAVIDATEEEIAEDYAKLGGIIGEEDIDESIFASVKKRIPWLIALLFLGLIVASVIGAFETVVTAVPVVFIFQSMISDMSGNVGTQSLAVTIRTLSDEDAKKKLKKAIFKELRIGIVNGLIVGVIAFVFVLLLLIIKHQVVIPSTDAFNIKESLRLSGIIGFSMLVAMTVSNLVGAFFPVILDKMHIDPAVASGPFITTLNDIIAVSVYYGLVWVLLIL